MQEMTYDGCKGHAGHLASMSFSNSAATSRTF